MLKLKRFSKRSTLLFVAHTKSFAEEVAQIGNEKYDKFFWMILS